MPRKRMVITDWRGVHCLVDGLSKNALGDLVVDLIRLQEGDEHLDGRPLRDAIERAIDPVLRLRGDRIPTRWGVAVERRARNTRDDTYQEQVRRAVEQWRATSGE